MIFSVKIPPPDTNSLDGIFQNIINNSLDPLDFAEIEYSGNNVNGDKGNLINRKGNFACWNGNVWVQLNFKNLSIYPKKYTLRGIFSSGWTYARKWNVFGYNDYNKDNENSWDNLGEGESGENFCGTDSKCTNSKFTTFPLKAHNPNRGYKYLRWKVTAGSTSYLTFAASAIELFGELTTKRKLCKTNNLLCHSSLNKIYVLVLLMCCY